MYAHHEISNTNIEAVFDLLLAMAECEEVPGEELPKQVLIISDMEFDEATASGYLWEEKRKPVNDMLFARIAENMKPRDIGCHG